MTLQSLAKLNGVKDIIVFDVEPLGCQPFILTLIPHTDQDLDPKGCLIEVNAIVQKFNKQLLEHVQAWREQYKANIVYLSQYDIKINLINDAESGMTQLCVRISEPCSVMLSFRNSPLPLVRLPEQLYNPIFLSKYLWLDLSFV